MPYNILTVNEKDKWYEALEKLPIEGKDVYYYPQYYSIYEKLGHGIANCFVYTKNNDIVLYPYLINSINSLGFSLKKEYFDIQGAYGYNGIISNSKNTNFIAEFYSAFNNYLYDCNVIAEFTRFHPLLQNYKLSLPHIPTHFDRYTICVDLHLKPEELWNDQFSSNTRNMIRKATKNNYAFKVILNPTIEEINDFIQIYYSNMRRIEAKEYYYFNEEYFFNIFENFPTNGFLLNVCNKDNQLLSSSIFLRHGQFLHYHLSGRSNIADNSVNSFAIHNAINFANLNNLSFLHLGGGRTSAIEDSLYKFKAGFYKSSLPFYIGKKIHNKVIYNEIINQWNFKNADNINFNSNQLLKYRN